MGHGLVWALTRRLAYGDRRIDPARVDLVDSMISANAVDALTDFVDTLCPATTVSPHSRWPAAGARGRR